MNYENIDAKYLTDELNVIKQNIDNVSRTKNLATIKDVLNKIFFVDINDMFQVAENIGEAYVSRFRREPDVYSNVPLSYIIEPKKLGAFFGVLYTKKDKDGNETKHSKTEYFNNYARFFIDLASNKVIYSKKIKTFVIVKEHSFKPLKHDNFNEYYPVGKNFAFHIDDFFDVALELYSDHMQMRHSYQLLEYSISGKDWRFDCERLVMKHEPPKENELFFEYFDIANDDLNITFADSMLINIANESESLNNIRLLHAYILLRKMKLIPSEKWFLLKDFGRTGKGLILKALNKIFKVNPVNMDALVNNQGASTENAWLSFMGADVAHANESGSIDTKGMRVLRKIATGEIITGRSLGKNAVSFKNESVLVLDTNENVDIGDITANTSRTVKIAFKDRPKNESSKDRLEYFKPYWDFIEPNNELSLIASVSFLINSLNYLNEIGGKFIFKDTVLKNYASAEDLTETQRIIILTIAQHGFILAKDEILKAAIYEDYGNLRFKEAKEDMKKIGVAINKPKWVDGLTCRVHKIGDKKIFDAALKMLEEYDSQNK